MRKKIKWVRHLGVLFLTIVIFTLGIFIGGNLEQMRVQNLYTQLQEQDVNYQNIVTEERYIDYLVGLKEKEGNNVSCELIKDSYYTSIKNLDDSRIKLENYINTGSVKEEEFARLKQHYANVQINYWILANRINDLCDSNMNPILYFYTNDKDCPSCQDQGVHLDYVKKKLGREVLIFSLDSQKEGPIKLLAQRYGVNQRGVPAVVIDENIYGFLTNDEVFDVLCENGLNSSVCG
jgi:hypothetical protein